MTQAVTGRRDRKKRQTKAALIAAALRLVDERGLDHVTVEEISEAADVSVRTFFNYFPSKDDVLVGDPVVDEEEVRELLRAVPAEISGVDAVLLAVGPAVERIEADRETWLLRMRVIKSNPALLPALLARAQESEDEFVRDLAERFGLPATDRYPQLVASLTGAALRTAIMRWATLGAGASLSDEIHEAFAVLRTGLNDPSAPKSTDPSVPKDAV